MTYFKIFVDTYVETKLPLLTQLNIVIKSSGNAQQKKYEKVIGV